MSGHAGEHVVRSDLESRRFGVAFGRLDAATPQSALPAAISKADADGLQVLSTRVNATDLNYLGTLEDLGFRIMDTLVYYRRALTGGSVGAALAELPEAFELNRADAEACSAIARHAFQGYMGHYHADPRLRGDAADAAYADWITRLLLTPSSDQISLGTASEQKLAGFLVGQPRENGASEIVLNAVSPDCRRAGHYSALLGEYLHRAEKRGDREVVISTQLQNYPVQRIWARAGFVLYSSFYTLHRWA
jgi:ribosomal protein S18 acetylase RimI-like enzyme